MKKIIAVAVALGIMLPAFAIGDNDDIKYQQKLENLRRKQEIECMKHPEKCTTSPMKETKMTLGTAQKSVKIGTYQDQVAMALGSPNIVTSDADGKETWIYDKVSTVTSYNNNGFDVYGTIILAGVNYNKKGGNTQTSQKTLTIVIKFDANKKVESFQYHMSSF